MSGHVAILGGGAWGSALACVARRTGHQVHVWVRDAETAICIQDGSNPRRLPGIPLARGITAGTDLTFAVSGADCILIAVPAQALRSVARAIAPHLSSGIPIAICAKGVERNTLKRMSQILAEETPTARACIFSGPTFAGEVAKGLPTAITLAAQDLKAAEIIQAAVGSGSLRAYLSDDPIGAEIGGAVKNVVAVAAGIATGRGLGENARAALVSRGLAEMMRLAVAEGGRAETVMGLSGAGDLILTAMSATSRNTSFGIALGEGRSAQSTLSQRSAVTEGYWTAQAVVALAARAGIEMPIAQAVNAILGGDVDIDAAIGQLLERPVTVEF